MEQLKLIAESRKIGHYRRHILLCIGSDCCSTEIGLAAWDELKSLLKDLNLSLAIGPNACYRSKVDCLRICQGGPILVVYPEGIWYGGMVKDRMQRFVQEHILGGQMIEEWVFARNPLPLP